MVQMILSDELPSPKNLRIKFRKVGVLQYIAHLDLVRTIMHAVTRAKLPVWFSEGFNPRPRLNFATPLSVGAESVCEYLDIKIICEVDCAAVREALNKNLPPELEIERVYYPNCKFNELKLASYEIKIFTAGADEALALKCNDLLNGDEIIVLKFTKKGERDTDIKPLVKSVSAELLNGEIFIKLIAYADDCQYLNPEYIVTFLKKNAGILAGPLDKEYYSIIRTGVYREDMTPFE